MISPLQDVAQEEIEDTQAQTLFRHMFGPRIDLASPGTAGTIAAFVQRQSSDAPETHRYIVIRSSSEKNRALEMYATGSMAQVNTFPLSTKGTGIFVAQSAAPSASGSQLQQIWENVIEKEFGDTVIISTIELTTKYSKVAKIVAGISNLQVPYEVNEDIAPLLHESTMQAVNIITGILADEISHGLPVKHITVESLIDRDAGQWSEVVFTIQVGLNSVEANREWDNILDKVSEMSDKQSDKEVAISLIEKVGIHFKWVISGNV